MKKEKGITLIEVMIATALITTSFAGTISFVSQYLKGIGGTHNFGIAINACQDQMERIKSHTHPTDDTQKISFDQLIQYNNRSFNVYADNGALLSNFKGVSYVKQITGPIKIYRIRTLVCWRDTNNRIIGTDLNLNGISDTGETVNSSGELESPAFIQTDIVNMD